MARRRKQRKRLEIIVEIPFRIRDIVLVDYEQQKVSSSSLTNSAGKSEPTPSTPLTAYKEVKHTTPLSTSKSADESRSDSINSIEPIIVGTTCHQCRHKTATVIKARCKVKHQRGQCSLNFCDTCLLARYGEKVDSILTGKWELPTDSVGFSFSDCHSYQWACPRCRGICNCSACRRKQNLKPTGILVHASRLSGLSSARELLLLDPDASQEKFSKNKNGKKYRDSDAVPVKVSESGSQLKRQEPALDENKKACEIKPKRPKVEKQTLQPPPFTPFLIQSRDHFLRFFALLEFSQRFAKIFGFTFKKYTIETLSLDNEEMNNFLQELIEYIAVHSANFDSSQGWSNSYSLKDLLIQWKKFPYDKDYLLFEALEENDRLQKCCRTRNRKKKPIISLELSQEKGLCILEHFVNLCLQTNAMHQHIDDAIAAGMEASKQERLQYFTWRKRSRENLYGQKTSKEHLLESPLPLFVAFGDATKSLKLEEKYKMARLSWYSREVLPNRHVSLGKDVFGNEYWQFFGDEECRGRIWCLSSGKGPFNKAGQWVYIEKDHITALADFLEQAGERDCLQEVQTDSETDCSSDDNQALVKLLREYLIYLEGPPDSLLNTTHEDPIVEGKNSETFALKEIQLEPIPSSTFFQAKKVSASVN